MSAKLRTITDANVLSVIDEVLVDLKQLNPRPSRDALVNDLTGAYCSVLASERMSSAARAERLGTFSTLTYGRLNAASP